MPGGSPVQGRMGRRPRQQSGRGGTHALLRAQGLGQLYQRGPDHVTLVAFSLKAEVAVETDGLCLFMTDDYSFGYHHLAAMTIAPTLARHRLGEFSEHPSLNLHSMGK
jgi:hypothetical protein